MKKVILTGFGPFGPYDHNPSGDLAKYYNGKIISDVHVKGIVLPCSYFGAFEVLNTSLKKFEPSAVISMGLSSSLKKIRIETTFRNEMNGKYPDENGFDPKSLPISLIHKKGETVKSVCDSIRLKNILHAQELPVELSDNADLYFCNSLGWSTKHELLTPRWLMIRSIFIHMPFTDNYKDKVNLEPSKIFLERGVVQKAIELLIEHI